ncbi:MAG: hypothetical protein PHC64_03765 [Candidatus Gastranaerophilales bacterium]|nr:hypothetical protein [Candidatus Gastranaerophilales bacterium]
MKSMSDINDWLDVQEHQKIGEILMQCGKLTLQDLGVALDIQNFENLKLGDILLNMKVINNEELELALDLQRQIDDVLERRSM